MLYHNKTDVLIGKIAVRKQTKTKLSNSIMILDLSSGLKTVLVLVHARNISLDLGVGRGLLVLLVFVLKHKTCCK